jgi:hypothetical protein
MIPRYERLASQTGREEIMRATLTIIAMFFLFGSNNLDAEIIKKDSDLAGKKFCWDGGFGTSTFNADHTYDFTGPSGNFHGKWTISKSGSVHIKFDDGHSRVDKFNVNGTQVFDSGPKGGNGTVC